jgi:hypothetical protein
VEFVREGVIDLETLRERTLAEVMRSQLQIGYVATLPTRCLTATDLGPIRCVDGLVKTGPSNSHFQWQSAAAFPFFKLAWK